MTTAFLFPGQGSYQPGCLARPAEESAAVREVLRTVDGIGRRYHWPPVSRLVTDPDSAGQQELADTAPELLQLAVFAASAALHAQLSREQGQKPDLVLGHSFGDVAALTAAGWLTLPDAIRVVCERMVAVQRFGPTGGGLVVAGLSRERARHLLAALGDPRLVVAGENSPEQTVLAGPADSLSRGLAALTAVGAWSAVLPVPYAFHHPEYRTAAIQLRRALDGLPVSCTGTAVFSDVLGRFLRPGDDLPALLSGTLVHPVRFLGAVRALHNRGARVFVECGARDVLTRLLPDCLPPVTRLAPGSAADRPGARRQARLGSARARIPM